MLTAKLHDGQELVILLGRQAISVKCAGRFVDIQAGISTKAVEIRLSPDDDGPLLIRAAEPAANQVRIWIESTKLGLTMLAASEAL